MLILRSAETHDKGINSEEEKDRYCNVRNFISGILKVTFFGFTFSNHAPILSFFISNASPNPYSSVPFPQE